MKSETRSGRIICLRDAGGQRLMVCDSWGAPAASAESCAATLSSEAAEHNKDNRQQCSWSNLCNVRAD